MAGRLLGVHTFLLLLSLGSAAPAGYKEDIKEAREEFIETFDKVLGGYLSELTPEPVGFTSEVTEAREEFFRVFNKALDGMIVAVFESDEETVREKKEAFLKTFTVAVDDLFESVEGFYTKEQLEARKSFHEAYLDAEAGRIGAQYIPYTPAVQSARDRFFQFFQFVVDGMLNKLSPRPGNNKLPEEIADFYLKDDPEVAEAKEDFDKLYRDALSGDIPSAIALIALEEAVNNNEDIESAAEELDETLEDIIDLVDDYELDLVDDYDGDLVDGYDDDLVDDYDRDLVDDYDDDLVDDYDGDLVDDYEGDLVDDYDDYLVDDYGSDRFENYEDI